MNKNHLGLWCAAHGMGTETTKKIVENERVAWELAQQPVDARGLTQAVYSAVRINGCSEAAKELGTPLGYFQFMNLVDQVNDA
jgi:hypothetical protein